MLLVCLMLVMSLPIQAFAEEKQKDTSVEDISIDLEQLENDYEAAPSGGEFTNEDVEGKISIVPGNGKTETSATDVSSSDTSGMDFHNGPMDYDVGDNEFEEWEPNDSMSLADTIYNDYTVSGDLSNSDPIDYYEIYISKKSTVTVACIANRSSLLIGMLNSSGTAIAAGTDTGVTSGGYYGDVFSITVNPGTYYIVPIDNSGYYNPYVFYIEVKTAPNDGSIASGTYGGLNWKITGAGVLTITGTGDMPDATFSGYAGEGDAPWSYYWDEITGIVVGNGITSIGEAAFAGCSNVTGVAIGSDVEYIGDYAFFGCEEITGIKLPDALTYIGDYAFENCTSLETITIPNNVETIGEGAFYNCMNLCTVTLGSSVETIGDFAFEDCGLLEKINIPASVTSIGYDVFPGCYFLEEINVASGNTVYKSIDGVVYSKDGTKLLICPGGKTSLTVPEGVTTVADSACYSCISLESVSLPSTLKVIENYGFCDCRALESITLPEGLEIIGYYAFASSTLLETIEIPASVESIGGEAFADCESLTDIFVDTNNTDYWSIDGVLYDYNEETLLCVPSTKTRVELPDTLENIIDGAFSGCYDMQSVIIPAGVEILGEYAFSNCAITDIFYDGNSSQWYDIVGSEDVSEDITVHFRGSNSSRIMTERIAGGSRTDTAARISSAAFESAENVVLANGDNYADALAGGSLAYALNAPILLVRGTSLDAATLAEMERLGTEKVYILGGTLAIGQSVVTQLRREGYEVERISGATRFDTAVEIANKLQEIAGAPSEVFFAYSHNYPDALAISGIAAAMGCPVLYISGDGTLSPSTAEFVRESGAETGVILGGYLAISAAAEDNIAAAGPTNTPRIYGTSRYDTCLEINKAYMDVMEGDTICVATGTNYPDALAGGVYAAVNGAPMVLVGSSTTQAQRDFFESFEPSRAVIFGGNVAVSTDVEGEIWAL